VLGLGRSRPISLPAVRALQCPTQFSLVSLLLLSSRCCFPCVLKPPFPRVHAINVGTEAKLRSIASAWRKQEDMECFGYQLGHQYTPITFSAAALKGRDGIVYQTLVNAKSSNGSPLFEVALVLMERYIFCRDEEVHEDETYPRTVITNNGAALDKGDGPYHWSVYKLPGGWLGAENDIKESDSSSQSDSTYAMFEMEEPDKEETEYFGNAPVKQKFWYYAAAVAIRLPDLEDDDDDLEGV
jgi:hypothetical protein